MLMVVGFYNCRVVLVFFGEYKLFVGGNYIFSNKFVLFSVYLVGVDVVSVYGVSELIK